MNQKTSQTSGQDGSIMVIALLIMATLAVAGAMLVQDAYVDSRIERNYAIQKQSVAAAEGAAKEIIQAVDSTFADADDGSEALQELTKKPWQPYDDMTHHFEFNKEDWGNYNFKGTNMETSLTFISSAEAIAVQTDASSLVTSGQSVTMGKVPEYFEYTVYSKVNHASAKNSETILVIGYQQKKYTE